VQGEEPAVGRLRISGIPSLLSLPLSCSLVRTQRPSGAPLSLRHLHNPRLLLESRWLPRYWASRLLGNPARPRLLKKVQMQGGVTHLGWVPGEVRGVLDSYVAAPHPSARWADGYPAHGYPSGGWATHLEDGYPADGPFSKPASPRFWRRRQRSRRRAERSSDPDAARSGPAPSTGSARRSARRAWPTSRSGLPPGRGTG